MLVYSHSRLNKNGLREGSKLLIDHLKGVRDKAFESLSRHVAFSFSQDELHQLLETISWLHDLGKYTTYFQIYLLLPNKVDWQLKSHSNLGAHTAFKLFQDNPETALLAFYLIKMHHSNLVNLDKVLWPDNYSQIQLDELEIFNKQFENLAELTELKMLFPKLNLNLIKLTNAKDLYDLYKKHLKKSASIERYFKVNYIFSLLIESDKLDASDTEPYQLVSLPENAVDARPNFGKTEFPDREIKSYTQNELRNYVRAKVVENINSEGILQKRIFTLAAPTGIGKTMASLDFVLKLRRKIEIEEGYIPQIIYGLPFINIIEQVLDEYEKTLGEGKILGHYQYADVFGPDEPGENGIEDAERFYSQKRMSWDTWQSDVVITSFVQLFETLIGHRNKLLKKFRHFADSIIILDEVQTLAIEKLPVIGAAIYHLCKYLNARVLIMTATQPKIFELMQRELGIQIENKNLLPLNLLSNSNEVFACFNRTKIIPLVNETINNNDFLEIFKSRWTADKSCLIVVNKVSRSIEVFNLLKEHIKENEKVELFYLSTNITPIQRKERIDQIRELLFKKTCVLVSTQVVEAGVDIDFDMGFRDLGPIDSIVQVAGRINRENSMDRKGSPLYIVDFGDCKRIYGHTTDIQARSSLNVFEIPENEYKPMVERYFDQVSDPRLSDFSFSKEIFNAMQNLDYSFPKSAPKKYKTVSDFRIIENSQEGVSVFVEMPNDQEGTEAREAYQRLLLSDLSKTLFDKKFKRTFNQRIIAVPFYLDMIIELKKETRLSEDMLWIKPNDIKYYYDNLTGFIRKQREKITSLSF